MATDFEVLYNAAYVATKEIIAAGNFEGAMPIAESFAKKHSFEYEVALVAALKAFDESDKVSRAWRKQIAA